MPRPDRWIAHHPTKCGADEMPEGYPCSCPPFWPRSAAYWRGETATGKRAVAALISKWKAEERDARQVS